MNWEVGLVPKLGDFKVWWTLTGYWNFPIFRLVFGVLLSFNYFKISANSLKNFLKNNFFLISTGFWILNRIIQFIDIFLNFPKYCNFSKIPYEFLPNMQKLNSHTNHLIILEFNILRFLRQQIFFSVILFCNICNECFRYRIYEWC